MSAFENQLAFEVLSAWGSHPRLRIARVNTGAAMVGPPGKQRLVKYGVPGTADICGLLAPTGRLVMIELKTLRAGSKQSDAQVTMQRVITAFGGAYCVARSLAEVDAFFTTLGVTR